VNAELRVTAAFLAIGCASCMPPPCEPPQPVTVAFQCRPNPLKSLPAPCYTTQLDEENVLYVAKLAFEALPADVQTKNMQIWQQAISVLDKGDQIFVDVCNAGNPPTPAQLDAIAQATQAFLTAIEPIFGDSSAGQKQMITVHEKAANMLKDLGR